MQWAEKIIVDAEARTGQSAELLIHPENDDEIRLNRALKIKAAYEKFKTGDKEAAAAVHVLYAEVGKDDSDIDKVA